MQITNIIIEDKVKEKILSKHNVEAREIKTALLSKPLVLKSRDGTYIAIGKAVRYITVVFTQQRNMTNIITGYPSSEAQMRLYKRKKGQ